MLLDSTKRPTDDTFFDTNPLPKVKLMSSPLYIVIFDYSVALISHRDCAIINGNQDVIDNKSWSTLLMRHL